MARNGRSVVVGLIVLLVLQAKAYGQTIIAPENDSTFVKEFRNANEWAVVAKEGFIVGLGNKAAKDDYGKYYQITVMIQNLTDSAYTFDPCTVHTDLKNKYGETVPLVVYTNEAYQKKVKRSQAWAAALYGFAAGLNAGTAGYQTSYVATRGYGGYTYMQPVTTYNYAAASQANMLATSQMMIMGKQMENDRKIREEGYLKETTIHSGEGIYGYMNIKRMKGKTMRIVVPVNGTEYVFDWDVEKKKKKK